jgi:hypothetical protein
VGVAGAQGPTGPTGATGVQGVTGPTGPAYTHYVGEIYGGGVVFYVDQTGNHGLICSMIDLGYVTWSNVVSLIGLTAQSDWDGQSNTNAIIAQAGHTGSAAKLCDDYTNVNYGTGAYSDWYLPSLHQLVKLWGAVYEVNKALDSDGNGATTSIIKNYYWSSTESTAGIAWVIYFYSSDPLIESKVNADYVRAVRAF